MAGEDLEGRNDCSLRAIGGRHGERDHDRSGGKRPLKVPHSRGQDLPRGSHIKRWSRILSAGPRYLESYFQRINNRPQKGEDAAQVHSNLWRLFPPLLRRSRAWLRQRRIRGRKSGARPGQQVQGDWSQDLCPSVITSSGFAGNVVTPSSHCPVPLVVGHY
jgi:hypothetical protein